MLVIVYNIDFRLPGKKTEPLIAEPIAALVPTEPVELDDTDISLPVEWPGRNGKGKNGTENSIKNGVDSSVKPEPLKQQPLVQTLFFMNLLCLRPTLIPKILNRLLKMKYRLPWLLPGQPLF